MKEMTVNYLACKDIIVRLKSISVRTVSQSNNHQNRMASLISSLKVTRYDYLPHSFSLTLQPPLFSIGN